MRSTLTPFPLRDPEKIKNAYTPDSIWRNRDTFLQGRDEIVRFLSNKWTREENYSLRKELFCFTDDKVRLVSSESTLSGRLVL